MAAACRQVAVMKLVERGADGKWYSPVWFAFILICAWNYAVIWTCSWIGDTYLRPLHIKYMSALIVAVLT